MIINIKQYQFCCNISDFDEMLRLFRPPRTFDRLQLCCLLSNQNASSCLCLLFASQGWLHEPFEIDPFSTYDLAHKDPVVFLSQHFRLLKKGSESPITILYTNTTLTYNRFGIPYNSADQKHNSPKLCGLQSWQASTWTYLAKWQRLSLAKYCIFI